MSTPFPENTSLYDLLEISAESSAQEIRNAYLQAKMAYRKDSVAIYTLVSAEETESFLRRIEEAYQTLSHPDKRREYDQRNGHIPSDPFTPSLTRNIPPPPNSAFTPAEPTENKVISIDRVPPMEAELSEADLFVAPSTDFASPEPTEQNTGLIRLAKAPTPTPTPAPAVSMSSVVTPLRPANPALSAPVRHSSQDGQALLALQQEVLQETEWKGNFLRRVRETKRMSLEELAESTKISKTYITAIEEENYPKLPAAVYLRGFITQIAKQLKLPSEAIAAAYLARHTQWKISKGID